MNVEDTAVTTMQIDQYAMPPNAMPAETLRVAVLREDDALSMQESFMVVGALCTLVASLLSFSLL